MDGLDSVGTKSVKQIIRMWGIRKWGLHNLVHIPEDWVGMVILGGVEPKIYALLSVTLASREYIGMKNVGFPGPVA